jgi:hypothetical protein
MGRFQVLGNAFLWDDPSDHEHLLSTRQRRTPIVRQIDT